MRQHKLFLLLLLLPSILGAQMPGKLLVVGGGSENYNSWSDAPYSWAVSQAPNKRVAIIGSETNPTSWLPTYFVARGASFAKNFSVATQAAANAQALYDSLVTYDMIFFRGGNQATYYSHYRNTLLQQAVEAVFNRGGVVGGTSAGLHILSKVVYTAINGTVYPEEALANPHNTYMTLNDNFFQFLPGVVFDSHVAERARFARTLGFVAKWKFDRNEDIFGIGVDDKTALCINQNLQATVYGTGAASIYRSGPGNTFSQGGTKLLATNVLVSQLIHGCSFNIANLSMSGLQTVVNPKNDGQIPASHIWLSASEALNKNQTMLNMLAQHVNPADTIIFVTTGSESNISTYLNWLVSNGFKAAVLVAAPSNGTGSWLGKVNRTNKFVFANAAYQGLMDFLFNTPVGQALRNRLFVNGVAVAFIGGNSRFAGRRFMLNYEQTYASYDGLIDLRNGIGLIRSSIIMPNTFAGSPIVDVENTATAVPYAMVRDSLRYGIWLHDDAVAHFRPLGNRFELTSYGNFPMIILENNGSPAALTNQSAVSSGLPRGIAGFYEFKLNLMDQSMTKTLDYYSAVSSTKSPYLIKLTSNRPSASLRLEGLPAGISSIKVFSTEGSLMLHQQISNHSPVDISALKRAVYIVVVEHNVHGPIYRTKFLKQ